MKRKIGILTYFGDLNPGTNLQCYSLYKNISALYGGKASVEIINYHSFRRLKRPFLTSVSIGSFLRDFKRITKYKKFQKEKFTYSSLHLLTNDFNRAKEYILKQEYDIIYIGSDTLLELHHADKKGVTIFWLPAEVRAKKILIAASSRDTEFESLTKFQIGMMTKSVSNMDMLGVRDDATKRLIRSLNAEKNIFKVPDPTFALDIDHSYAEKYLLKRGISKNDKLLCIHLTRKFTWGKEFAQIAKSNGFKIVSIRPCYYADYEFNDLSPLEYSGIFKFFIGVITYRFHDTVFSLKNQTPVVTTIPDAAYSNRFGESKHSSILKDFGLLESNFINNPIDLVANELYQKVIDAINLFDADQINKVLSIKKGDFLDFLKKTV